MRKIIITVIATIVLIAPFEKAKGQDWEQYKVTSANFPTVNILTGVNAKLSFGLWRFEPFFQLGGYLQMFEERMTTEGMWLGSDGTPHFLRNELYSQRFAFREIFYVGVKFRVTDRDRIVFGVRQDGSVLFHRDGANWGYAYLGYIRRESLSERMSIEFSVLFTPSQSRWMEDDFWGFGSFGAIDFLFGAIDIGVKLNYEIARNLKLNVQLRYAGLFNVRYASWLRGLAPENISGERLFTRNFIDFSIGIHYHLGRQRQQQQQVAHRQPRQRVAPSRRPTHRVAPSTFNHPTLPPRGR